MKSINYLSIVVITTLLSVFGQANAAQNESIILADLK